MQVELKTVHDGSIAQLLCERMLHSSDAEKHTGPVDHGAHTQLRRADVQLEASLKARHGSAMQPEVASQTQSFGLGADEAEAHAAGVAKLTHASAGFGETGDAGADPGVG